MTTATDPRSHRGFHTGAGTPDGPAHDDATPVEDELAAATQELLRHGREARAGAAQLFTSMKAAVSTAEDAVRGNLEARPYVTLGAAAGVGYVLAGGLATSMTRVMLKTGFKLATTAWLGNLTQTLASSLTQKEEDMSATTQQLSGNWTQFKGKLREAWGALSDNDLDRYEGQLDQLVGHIQSTTGEARANIADRVQELARTIRYRF